MNKTLFQNFSSKILNANLFIQFLLIVVFANIHYLINPSGDIAISFLMLVGSFSRILWIHGVSYSAYSCIEKRNETYGNLPLLEISIFIPLIPIILLIFSPDSLGTSTMNLGFANFTYTEPLLLLILSLWALLYSLVSTAKMIKYAETGEEPYFSKYFTTLLLVAFPIIGIFFIKERLKNLDNIKIKKIEHDNNDQKNHVIKIPNDIYTNKNYKCKEGVLTVTQEYTYPNIGEYVLLNNEEIENGNFKIGIFTVISVKNSVIIAIK